MSIPRFGAFLSVVRSLKVGRVRGRSSCEGQAQLEGGAQGWSGCELKVASCKGGCEGSYKGAVKVERAAKVEQVG